MSEPLDALPGVYARFLRLRAAGRTDAEIAAALELPPESIPLVAEIAQDKLSAVRAAELRESPDG